MTLPGLRPVQQELVDAWLPGARLVEVMGWGQADRAVLHVAHDAGGFVVKASGPGDEHVLHEIAAHRRWTAPLVEAGRAPEMLWCDDDARILVTRFVPGHLVSEGPEQDDPEVFRQAGELLALLHHPEPVVDTEYVARLCFRTLDWLTRPHRIDPAVAAAVEDEVRGWEAAPVEVVGCHADFQPRNWVVGDGRVSIIDFGGMEPGPAALDLVRVTRNDFARTPSLEPAFLDGYGSDPRDTPVWRQLLLAEAVATAVWAFDVGDEAFEHQGHGWLAGLAGVGAGS